MASPVRPQRHATYVLAATALLSGLAAGALGCLLALLLRRDPMLLMLPAAFGIGWFMRWQGYDRRRGAAAAAAAMLLCLLYAQYLYAAIRIADTLGFPLRDTLFKMDVGLTWQMVRANFGAWDAVAFVLAPLLAGMVAARWPSSSGPTGT